MRYDVTDAWSLLEFVLGQTNMSQAITVTLEDELNTEAYARRSRQTRTRMHSTWTQERDTWRKEEQNKMRHHRDNSCCFQKIRNYIIDTATPSVCCTQSHRLSLGWVFVIQQDGRLVQSRRARGS